MHMCEEHPPDGHATWPNATFNCKANRAGRRHGTPTSLRDHNRAPPQASGKKQAAARARQDLFVGVTTARTSMTEVAFARGNPPLFL